MGLTTILVDRQGLTPLPLLEERRLAGNLPSASTHADLWDTKLFPPQLGPTLLNTSKGCGASRLCSFFKSSRPTDNSSLIIIPMLAPSSLQFSDWRSTTAAFSDPHCCHQGEGMHFGICFHFLASVPVPPRISLQLRDSRY